MPSTLKTVRFSRVLLPLWIAYAVYTISRRPFSVARSEIQRETGLTAAHTALVDTVFTITYTIGQLNYGHFKRQLGNKQILMYGLVCSALSSLLVGVSSSLWIFCFAWALNGFAQAAGWATCLSILNVWIYSEERGSVMGWWSTNMSVGGVLGNVLPAFLISYGANWRVALAIEAVLVIVVSCVISQLLVQHSNVIGLPSVQQEEAGINAAQLIKYFPQNLNKDGEIVLESRCLQKVSCENSPPLSRRNSDDVVNGKDESTPSPSLIFCHPQLIGIYMSNFLHKLVRYTFIFWLPYYVIEELKCSIVNAGFISAMFDIGGIGGTVLSGYFSDRMFRGSGRTRVVLLFTAGMFLTTLSLAVFQSVLADNKIIFTLIVSLIGFFAFGIDALITGSFLLDYLERTHMSAHAGAVSGVVGGMGSAGSIFQGLFTVILSSSSWANLFFSLAISTLLGGFCLYRPLLMEMPKREIHPL